MAFAPIAPGLRTTDQYAFRELELRAIRSRSCFIIGEPSDVFLVDEMFGLFGEIEHHRVIPTPSDSPSQLYVQYASIRAAKRAVEWCLKREICAKRGCQRYCPLYLCGQQCDRQNCPDLHRPSTIEIMNTDETKNSKEFDSSSSQASSSESTDFTSSEGETNDDDDDQIESDKIEPESDGVESSEVVSSPNESSEADGGADMAAEEDMTLPLVQQQFDQLLRQFHEHTQFLTERWGEQQHYSQNLLAFQERQSRCIQFYEARNAELESEVSEVRDELFDFMVAALVHQAMD